MRRCYPAPEPKDFDSQVRKAGQNWRSKNPDKLPKDFWKHCKDELAEAFDEICCYTAMRIIPPQDGTVDHYLSKKNRPDLAYEWSNYRYCTGYVNSCKGNYDDRILDPFDAEADWFEVLIPSLQLVLTDQVPLEFREKAEFTLHQLQLQDSKRIIKKRTYYYNAYKKGNMSIEQLEQDAPLLARAIHSNGVKPNSVASSHENLGDL
jgi:hypothetical protein